MSVSVWHGLYRRNRACTESWGDETGAGMPRLLAAASQWPDLIGVPSQILQTGRCSDLYPTTADFSDIALRSGQLFLA
jgi:hypothetical protein